MAKAKLLFLLSTVALAIILAWQLGACELANRGLQEDLTDLASQAGVGIGLVAPSADEDLRSAVIRRAKEREIQLEPQQVTVQRAETAEGTRIHLAADYDAHVNLLGFSFTFHFNPSSTDKHGG